MCDAEQIVMQMAFPSDVTPFYLYNQLSKLNTTT